MESKLNIIDTLPAIKNLSANYLNGDSSIVDLWKDYMSPYPVIMNMCYEDAVNDNLWDRVYNSLDRTLNVIDEVEIANKNFYKAVKAIEEQFYKLYPSNAAVDLFFYIGLCNGAGWAEVINDKGCMLFGVEMITELEWHHYDKMIGLVSHELGHEIHRKIRGEYLDQSFDAPKLNGIWQLYIEGMGQRLQQLLLGDDSYHQDSDGWLEYCKTNEERLKKIYYNLLEDGESVQAFFGSWIGFEDRHDIGYYLGCRWIQEMLKDMSLEEVSCLSLKELEKEVSKFLN